MLAYRSSVHSSTRMTPNMMTFGRESTLPMVALIGLPTNDDISPPCQYVDNLQQNLVIAHQVARTNLKKNAIYRKRYYDQSTKHRTLNVMDLVWLYDPARKVGVCTKLSPKWTGPCLVVRKIDDTTYVVKKSAKHIPKVYHIDKLTPYQGNTIPKWIKKSKL